MVRAKVDIRSLERSRLADDEGCASITTSKYPDPQVAPAFRMVGDLSREEKINLALLLSFDSGRNQEDRRRASARLEEHGVTPGRPVVGRY